MAKNLAITNDVPKALDTKKTQKIIARPTAAELAEGLIISLKEARKIMGVDARTLSDDELTVEIWRLWEVASDLLKSSSTSVGK